MGLMVAILSVTALLQSLGDIQIAMNVLKSREHMDEHPIDRHYHGLNCKLDYVDPEDGVFKMVEKYVRQTHGWTHKQYQLQVSSRLRHLCHFTR